MTANSGGEPGGRVLFFDELPSTSDFLKEHHFRYPAGTVVRAGAQGAGRGQHGRRFESQPGGLYFSILYRPPREQIDRLALFPPLLSVALNRAFHALGLKTRVKWINDIFLGEGKVAGLLSESILQGREIQALIAGIGVNVNNSIGEETRREAAARGYEVGRLPLSEMTLEALLEHLLKWCDEFFALFCRADDQTISGLYLHETGFDRPHWFQLADGSLLSGRMRSLTRAGRVCLAGDPGHEGYEVLRIHPPVTGEDFSGERK